MTDTKSSETTPGKAGKAYPDPTAQEAYFFFNILKNQKSKPEIDWDAVAVDSGFKNADVAKVRFGQVKKKLGLDAGAATKTPTKGSAKKAGKPTTPTDDILGVNTAGAKVDKKPRKRGPAKPKAQAQAQPVTPKNDMMASEGNGMDDMPDFDDSPSHAVKYETSHVKAEEEEQQYSPVQQPIHGLPVMPSFRAANYRSSPLDYSDYSFKPDEGHDI